MDNIDKNVHEHNPNKKCKILILFDIFSGVLNKKRNPIVIELFRRGGKLNISFVFITFYFSEQKNISSKYDVQREPGMILIFFLKLDLFDL